MVCVCVCVCVCVESTFQLGSKSSELYQKKLVDFIKTELLFMFSQTTVSSLTNSHFSTVDSFKQGKLPFMCYAKNGLKLNTFVIFSTVDSVKEKFRLDSDEIKSVGTFTN